MASISALPAQYQQTAARMPESLLKSITAVEATARCLDHERLMQLGCSSGLSVIEAQGFFTLAASILKGDHRPGDEAVSRADKAVQAELVKATTHLATTTRTWTRDNTPKINRAAATGAGEPNMPSYKRFY